MANGYSSQGVSLGCGTLILIALIVLFFSRPGISDLEREVHGLQQEITELKKTIDTQTDSIKELQKQVSKGK